MHWWRGLVGFRLRNRVRRGQWFYWREVLLRHWIRGKRQQCLIRRLVLPVRFCGRSCYHCVRIACRARKYRQLPAILIFDDWFHLPSGGCRLLGRRWLARLRQVERWRWLLGLRRIRHSAFNWRCCWFHRRPHNWTKNWIV